MVPFVGQRSCACSPSRNESETMYTLKIHVYQRDAGQFRASHSINVDVRGNCILSNVAEVSWILGFLQSSDPAE